PALTIVAGATIWKIAVRRAGCAGAAVFGEEADQARHRAEVRRIDDEASVLARRHQIRVRQVLQMEGEARRGKPQLLGGFAGRHAFRPRDDEQAEDREARIMGKRAQRADSKVRVHEAENTSIASIFQYLWKYRLIGLQPCRE